MSLLAVIGASSSARAAEISIVDDTQGFGMHPAVDRDIVLFHYVGALGSAAMTLVHLRQLSAPAATAGRPSQAAEQKRAQRGYPYMMSCMCTHA